MASALFSMLFLETAMFAQFGADTSMEVKIIYDNTYRSRNQCGGCHNGNLYDCTDDQRN